MWGRGETRGSWALLVALAACTGPANELSPSPAQPLDGGPATGLEALTGVGTVPYRTLLRATNRFGASVERDPVSVVVGGASSTVSFDGFGFAGVTLDAPGTYEVEPSGGVAGTAHVVASTWPGLGYHPAWLAPIPETTDLLSATDGFVGRAGAELWWTGGATPAHRVFAADEELLGARMVNVDVDGVLDLVTWTSKEVYLLRGRAGGGFAWGTGYLAPGLSVAGADVADLSSDNLPDLAIAWIGSDGGGVLDVWEGDGLFGFAAAEPRAVDGRPVDLQIDDATGEGVPQVTVLLSDNTWSRFIRGAELQYIPLGPYFPVSVVVPPESTLARVGDVNRDEGAEIGVATPFVAGQARSLWLVDVALDGLGCAVGQPGSQCQVQPRQVAPGGAFTYTAGHTADPYRDDLFLLTENRELHAYTRPNNLSPDLAHGVVGTFPAFGPIAAADPNHDGVSDLVIAGPTTWRQWIGQPANLQLWRPRPTDQTFVREGALPWWAPIETDGDPDTLEFAIATSEEGEGTYFRLVQYDLLLGGRAETVSSRPLGSGGPTDLAACGTDVYLVTGGQLVAVDLTDPTRPVVVGPVGNNATRLACGAGPGGSRVAVLEGGTVVLRNQQLAQVSSVPAAGAVDVELLDLGGATLDVRTCDTPGCGVAAWSWGPGQRSVVVGDETSLRVVEGPGSGTVLGGFGRPTAVDLDEDGHEDLVAFSTTGLVTLHRSTGEGVAPAELFHSPLPLIGTVWLFDADFDGWLDPFVVDPNMDLVYTHLPDGGATTTPSDTGLPADTGSP